MSGDTKSIFSRANLDTLLGRGTPTPAPRPRAKTYRLDAELDALHATQGEEIRRLEETGLGLAETIRDVEAIRKATAARAREIERTHSRQFLHDSVTELAQPILAAGDSLLDQFLAGETLRGFVLSLDLRGSTSLMLKAKSPAHFARLMTEAMVAVEHGVKEHLGVFDKFTGDGALAFFPDFFSGPDAGLRALHCARGAMAAFDETLKRHRSSFVAVPADAGLGAGLDYGDVTLLRVCGALTVLGTPVVYACRLGSAPAGSTYANQAAFDVLTERHAPRFEGKEVKVPVKNESPLLAYEIELNGDPSSEPLARPSWLQV